VVFNNSFLLLDANYCLLHIRMMKAIARYYCLIVCCCCHYYLLLLPSFLLCFSCFVFLVLLFWFSLFLLLLESSTNYQQPLRGASSARIEEAVRHKKQVIIPDIQLVFTLCLVLRSLLTRMCFFDIMRIVQQGTAP
jgi:hypothetical protein